MNVTLTTTAQIIFLLKWVFVNLICSFLHCVSKVLLLLLLGKNFYNNLNVPVLQRKKHEKLCSLMLKMHGLVSDFCRQLSDLYTFLIQRLCSISSDSSLQEIVLRVRRNKIISCLFYVYVYLILQFLAHI